MKKINKRKFKECLSYVISVEGENCEVMYFNHLQNLINNCEYSKYNVNIDVKKKNPISFAKSKTIPFAKVGKNNEIKFYHVQDIEDYYDKFQLNKFHSIIDEVVQAKKLCRIPYYELGYTNYTFDLWMVIHKYNLNYEIEDRSKYYIYLNRGYNKNYKSMGEYKNKDEFESILKQIELKDVINAINIGKAIRKKHKDNNEYLEIYNGFKYYRDNPDMSLHLVVEEILINCGIIKGS